MPRVLKDIKISEVSSVDRGAGRGVKVLLMKRDDASQETDMPLDAAIQKAIDDAVTAATKTIGEALTKAQGDLVKANDELTLLKMTDAQKAYMAGCGTEDAKKAFRDMSSDQRDAHMKAHPHVQKSDPVEHGDLAKRDAIIATQTATIDALTKRLDAVDLEKAQADFKKRAVAAGLKEEDGETMRKAFGGDAAAQASLEKRFAEVKAAAEALEKTSRVFDEFGTRKGQTGTALDSLNAKADEFRKTDAGKGLTIQQAFTKVYEDPANAELVRDYKAEEARKRLSIVAA